MLIRTLLACSMVLALAACDSVFGSDGEVPERGYLSFQHAPFGGVDGGTYSAVGNVPTGGSVPEWGEWAFAHLMGTGAQSVQIAASRKTAEFRYDVVTVLLPQGARTGQRITFLDMCETVPSCGHMSFAINLNPNSGTPANVCWLSSGEMRLSRLTSRRATGTFSGNIRCANPPVGPAVVQDGEFDVAIVNFAAG